MICKRCEREVNRKDMQRHLAGERCTAIADTRYLYAHDLRPFLEGHSLPEWLPTLWAKTFGEYEGEPRKVIQASNPIRQHWVPLWVDLIVTHWVGRHHNAQRDGVLLTVYQDEELQRSLEAAWRLGGTKALGPWLHSRGLLFGVW